MFSGPLTDERLQCVSCGDAFIFTAGERELYRLRGIETNPQRCPRCTRAHRVPPSGSQRERG